jgi:hypothetical protein
VPLNYIKVSGTSTPKEVSENIFQQLIS